MLENGIIISRVIFKEPVTITEADELTHAWLRDS